MLEDEASCLKPCKGFYADMKISQYGEKSVLTMENNKNKRFILDYANYKGKLTDSGGFGLSHFLSPDIKGRLE